jgi:hypothetical protein
MTKIVYQKISWNCPFKLSLPYDHTHPVETTQNKSPTPSSSQDQLFLTQQDPVVGDGWMPE